MKYQTRRQRRSREEVGAVLKDFERSGLSQSAFAAGRGIPLSTLQYWLRRSREETSGQDVTTPQRMELVPIRIVDPLPAPSQAMLELESDHGYLLRFPAGLSPELLARYVETLERRC